MTDAMAREVKRTEGEIYFDACLKEASKNEYLKEVVPSANKTVGCLTAMLSGDAVWMARAFMTKERIKAGEIATLARHIYEQCIVLEVPFYLFKEGCVFFNGITPKYHSVWAISLLRQQAMKEGLPIVGNDFRVLYDVPRIGEILERQEEYLKDIIGGNAAMYASMSLRNVMGEERSGCFRFRRGELVIFGAEVTFYIDGHPQNPVYFGVDFSKTSHDIKRPYGSYQQQVVRTKAIRHAMQSYYGPLLPRVQTVDEAIGGDITGDEDAETAMRHYNIIEEHKATRRAEIMGGSV